VTEYEIEWERIVLDITASSPNVESMLETLDGEYTDDVPVNTFIAAAATQELPTSAVFELYALRWKGDPRPSGRPFQLPMSVPVRRPRELLIPPFFGSPV
jgi:hypothetical protein